MTTAGWYPDPVGRHEQRYWDGAAWTTIVAAAGSTFDEAQGPPPVAPMPPAPGARPMVTPAPPVAAASPPTATPTARRRRLPTGVIVGVLAVGALVAGGIAWAVTQKSSSKREVPTTPVASVPVGVSAGCASAVAAMATDEVVLGACSLADARLFAAGPTAGGEVCNLATPACDWRSAEATIPAGLSDAVAFRVWSECTIMGEAATALPLCQEISQAGVAESYVRPSAAFPNIYAFEEAVFAGAGAPTAWLQFDDATSTEMTNNLVTDLLVANNIGSYSSFGIDDPRFEQPPYVDPEWAYTLRSGDSVHVAAGDRVGELDLCIDVQQVQRFGATRTSHATLHFIVAIDAGRLTGLGVPGVLHEPTCQSRL